jgi:hypothetical protein
MYLHGTNPFIWRDIIVYLMYTLMILSRQDSHLTKTIFLVLLIHKHEKHLESVRFQWIEHSEWFLAGLFV